MPPSTKSTSKKNPVKRANRSISFDHSRMKKGNKFYGRTRGVADHLSRFQSYIFSGVCKGKGYPLGRLKFDNVAMGEGEYETSVSDFMARCGDLSTFQLSKGAKDAVYAYSKDLEKKLSVLLVGISKEAANKDVNEAVLSEDMPDMYESRMTEGFRRFIKLKMEERKKVRLAEKAIKDEKEKERKIKGEETKPPREKKPVNIGDGVLRDESRRTPRTNLDTADIKTGDIEVDCDDNVEIHASGLDMPVDSSAIEVAGLIKVAPRSITNGRIKVNGIDAIWVSRMIGADPGPLLSCDVIDKGTALVNKISRAIDQDKRSRTEAASEKRREAKEAKQAKEAKEREHPNVATKKEPVNRDRSAQKK